MAAEVYEYTIDLWQTGLTVERGSRLRVEVSSAAFPLFSRNLNTGGHNEKETRHPAGNAGWQSGAGTGAALMMPRGGASTRS